MSFDSAVEFALTAEDEYSDVFNDLKSQIEALSGDITVGITADTSALDDVKSAIAELSGASEIDIPVNVTGDASDQISTISADVANLSGQTADITVNVDDEASTTLADLQSQVDALSSGATIGVSTTGGVGAAAGGVGGLGEAAAGAGGAGLLAAAGPIGVAVGAVVGAGAALSSVSGQAATAQDSITRLQLAVTNSGTAWSDVADKTNAYITTLSEATGVSHTAIESTAADLLLMGMNYTTAMGTVASALDLAAAKQIDVETAANMLGKAWEGNYTILTRYGIVVDAATKKTGDWGAILDIVEQHFKDAAVTMGDTFSGEMGKATNAWNAFQSTIGSGINWLGSTVITGLMSVFGLGGAPSTAPSIAGQPMQGMAAQTALSTLATEPAATVTTPLATTAKATVDTAATVQNLMTQTQYQSDLIAQQTAAVSDLSGNLERFVTTAPTPTVAAAGSSSWQHAQGGGIIPRMSGKGTPILAAEQEPEAIAPISDLQSMMEQWGASLVGKIAPSHFGTSPNIPVPAPGHFGSSPNIGVQPGGQQTQKVEHTFTINVRGATTTDLQFANQVAKQLSQLNALKGTSGRSWSNA